MKIVINIIRVVFALLSVGAFAVFVCPMFGLIINVGNIAGALFSVWVFCLSVKPLHEAIKGMFQKNKFSKIMFYVVNACFIIFSVYGAVVTGAMIYAACQAPAEGATAVVLGAQVRESGPSAMLRARIEAAEDYLSENPYASAVLSGGQGEDEVISEADCMYNTMSADGADTSRLYMEYESTNTAENIGNSVAVIDSVGLRSDMAVVTDGFHQLRVRIIAKKLGLENNIGAVNARTRLLYLPTYTVREWFAIPNQIFFR